MKYNPKINELLAADPKFALAHPLQPDSTVQGHLELYYKLEQMLCEITGMDAFTFQPAAGAHGELCGVMMMRAYHEARGEGKRKKMLIPDSAHGTNPASAAMAGFTALTVKSNERGQVDMDDLRSKLDDECAGIMLTNPNTLGIFEENIPEIARLVHEAGGLLYYDGANLNAILMQARPGDMGFDLVHLNVHKSFSTPHGGGGPGAGPVGVKKKLLDFLPLPRVIADPEHEGRYKLLQPTAGTQSIGKMRAFAGSFAILLRTYAYLLREGVQGLKEISSGAVANARYLRKQLESAYDFPFKGETLHEFVLAATRQKKQGASAMDLAKGLIEYGMHPPTVYFPLIVHEAMMFEPTESLSKADLDRMAEAMLKLAERAEKDPESLRAAPQGTPVRRPDDVLAAKKPKPVADSKEELDALEPGRLCGCN